MTAAPTTVLVVDDDDDVRSSLVDVLSDEGYRIATAADGLEALGWLRSHESPELILLDWMMPRCDALEFRSAQRADPRLASIPVVLLTADARFEEKRKALDANDVLMKPMKLEDLLRVVARHCRSSFI